MAKAGRKSKYETHVQPFLSDIKDAIERGVEEKKIAEKLDISISTWCDYKNKFPEFAEVFKSKDMSGVIKQLDGALLDLALGKTYEDTKIYETTDADGRTKRHKEIVKHQQPPNVTAIFGAYNRFDPNYKKDRAYFELKKQELKLRAATAQDGAFDELDFDFDELNKL